MQLVGGFPPSKSAFVSVSSWAWEAGPGPAHGGPASQVAGQAWRVGAEAVHALGEAGRRQASRGGSTKALKMEGVAGSWRPTKRLPAKPGEVLGNGSARLKCQGHGSRRAAGAEMWVTAARAPGMLGGVTGPGPASAWSSPQCHRPTASLGDRSSSGEAGALRPSEGAGARAQPSRWLGRRPAGPSPAPQPDTRESGTASSPFPEEALSAAGFPAWNPTSGGVHSWGQPDAPLFQTGDFPPSLPPPRRHFLPHSPFLGVFPSRDGPLGDQEPELQISRTLVAPSSSPHLHPLPKVPERVP